MAKYFEVELYCEVKATKQYRRIIPVTVPDDQDEAEARAQAEAMILADEIEDPRYGDDAWEEDEGMLEEEAEDIEVTEVIEVKPPTPPPTP